ncbi:ATP-binding protein [Streptomonospora wellingtoniae]|uniref:ATP-binding protein n=1 Tax=Streptomonospora wellingtoniae TaxID=3075544 RepID=A0ABU2KW97_9ACTN|nr:ATP-binding protein [Streptomonospora sp. DSM 45055]MDT0303537.1 ATP-binding protein [Streptomonospora sp. DSM 45055]
MGDSDHQKADVLDYWRSVEYFLPQDLPKVGASKFLPVADVDPVGADPLPWQPGHQFQRQQPAPANKEWRHTVYCGAIDLHRVRDLLREKFGAEDFVGDVEERPLGRAPVAAFVLDSAGRPLLDTEGLGSCGWAVGETLDPGPGQTDWLVGFEAVEDVFRLLFEWLATGDGECARTALLTVLDDDPLEAEELSDVWELLETAADKLARNGGLPPDPDGAQSRDFARPDSNAADGHRRALTAADLRVCTEMALRLCGIDGFALPLVRVKSEQVTSWQAAKEHSRQQDTMHQRAADRGECEPPPEQPPPPDVGEMLNSRIADDLARVAAAVRNGRFGAALRGYLSPSESTRRIKRHDLRAESGTQRAGLGRTPAARWPAKTAHPLVFGQQVAVNSVVEHLGGDRSGLFAVNGPPGTGKTTLLRDLVAHVVAERARALARLATPDDAYSAPVTWRTGKKTHTVYPLIEPLTGHEIVVASANNGAVENVTTEIPGADAIAEEWADSADYFAEVGEKVLDGPSWGVLAARLGRQSNRLDFARRFWEGGPPQPQADGRRRPPGGGMDDVLKRANAGGIQRWRAAVSAFNDAEREVERLRRQRRDFVTDTHRLADLRRAAEEAPAAVERAQQRRDTARAGRQKADEQHRNARETWRMWEQSAARHWELRPGILRRIVTLDRAHREWKSRQRDMEESLSGARAAEQESARSLDGADEEVLAGERELAAAVDHRERTERDYTAVKESTDRGWREWEGFIPSSEVLADDHSRELASIWGDPELTAARTRVFLAAVELHRAFIECSASKMRANLAVADQVLRGRQAAEAPAQGVLGAWRSLFMVVPVVSSTFSSFAKQFSAFGREELGWLLIDEAGQATPQQAVGALWRSRRAVVVGDPLQLEPICSLPYTAQEALRRHYGVEGKWVPERTSVQQLADEVTPLGTELIGPEGEPLWVGCPLRVHRRCDSPMFDISNEVAYGGMMVFGTPERRPLEGIANSAWVDVPAAGETRDHWVESERVPLRRVLQKLSDRGQDMNEVFVVSPFASVAKVASRIAQDCGVPNGNAGTVHTTQGKEADVVVLVLGGDPSKPRAKEWAAQRPNLVNVAVSRAKRRLYVIGDRAAWAKLDHFSTLADRLPHHGFAPT